MSIERRQRPDAHAKAETPAFINVHKPSHPGKTNPRGPKGPKGPEPPQEPLISRLQPRLKATIAAEVQHKLKSASEVQQNKLGLRNKTKGPERPREPLISRPRPIRLWTRGHAFKPRLEEVKSLANARQHRRGSGKRDTRLQPHPRGPKGPERPQELHRRSNTSLESETRPRSTPSPASGQGQAFNHD